MKAKAKPSSLGLLRPIAKWLIDENVSEILLNRPQEIFVEKEGKMNSRKVPEFNDYTLECLFQLIANENQQLLNKEHPILSGSLLDGSRVQLVIPPISVYPTFSI